jgi:hypothetical protein
MRAKIIIRNNSEYDHEELEFDNKRGKAFIGKEDLKIGLERCPICDTENYAPAVMSGRCYNCGFDANSVELIKYYEESK